MQRQEFLKVLTDKLIGHGFERKTLVPGEEGYMLNDFTVVTVEGKECVAWMMYNDITWTLLHEFGDWIFDTTTAVYITGCEFPFLGHGGFHKGDNAIKKFLETIDRIVRLMK
jgi:hypothetical protein